MNSRADTIFHIIEQNSERMKVSEIHTRLCEAENVSAQELKSSIVSSTVKQDNKTKEAAGRVKRFKIFGDGEEEYGYVSIIRPVNLEATKTKILDNYLQQIPLLIEEANNKFRKELKTKIGEKSWQEFESTFLCDVLEALGFSDIQLTQPTRDGGRDAECCYKRGLVQSQVIVSAKHWTKKKVGIDEVQRLRGINHIADTAIIVTSNSFSSDAIREASPSSNQRSVVLIDGDLIVNTCLEKNILVESFNLPTLYKFVD